MAESAARISKLLVVDDDVSLARAIGAALGDQVGEIRACADTCSAIALLGRFSPDLILLDLSLPDGDAFDVLDFVQARPPTPLVIVISGTASPDASFQLARRGVYDFLTKPFDMKELWAAIEAAGTHPVDLTPHVKNMVGQRPIHEVESEVRRTMVNEALARSRGNRRAAAKILRISRQLLQHIIRRGR